MSWFSGNHAEQNEAQISVIEDPVPTFRMTTSRVAMAPHRATSASQRIASETAITVMTVWLVVLLGTSALVVKSHF